MTAVTRDHDHDHGNLETITSGSVMTTGTWRLSYRLETESDIWKSTLTFHGVEVFLFSSKEGDAAIQSSHFIMMTFPDTQTF